MSTKYRKQLSAILEGMEMPAYDRLQLIGGLAQEFEYELRMEMARLRGYKRSAVDVFESHQKYLSALKALEVDLSDEESGRNPE